ncbi:hypothetical protein ABEB36_009912 [Hypothenemus hampei]|uniref:BRISC and BRCA1-A complex member 2 n=1 Tax=Hypothenemus hampei TaxID=57062 RepID=A0ABD1EHX6_HYPHA
MKRCFPPSTSAPEIVTKKLKQSNMSLILNNSDYYNHLKINLDTLLNGAEIGLSRFQPENIQTKRHKHIEMIAGFTNYHFMINIPFAGKFLNWEVIFDPENYSELPDFDFNDNSFLCEPDINYISENVPSWDSWDLTNPQCLQNILNEFLSLYKKTQVDKLMKQNKYANLKAQYEEILKTMNLPPNNLEVCLENKTEFDYNQSTDGSNIRNLSKPVRFFILLPIDLSKLPCQDEGSASENYVNLTIEIKDLDSTQVKGILNVCPRLENLFGKELKLPKCPKDASLAQYAKLVQTTIENHIKLIVEQQQARSLFVSAIVDSFSHSIVEYDAKRFFKIVFIYEDVEDYECLVTIELGNNFPRERPKVKLQSLYCQSGRTCYKLIVYIYNPESDLEENINTLRDTLLAEVKTFQEHTHN